MDFGQAIRDAVPRKNGVVVHAKPAEVLRAENNDRNARYRGRHAVAIKGRHRKWRAENPARWRTLCRNGKTRLSNEALLLHGARARARKFGLECTITLDDVHIPLTCPVLGIPLKRVGGKPVDTSPSIDRIDAARGYTPDNIAVISNRANRVKAHGTAEEHEQIAAWMRGHKGGSLWTR